MARGYSFRPRLWPWLLAGAACAAGIALGNWQSRRAEEKRALGERFEQALRAPALDLAWPVRREDVLGRRVAARGTFDAEKMVFLDNKIMNGRVGYEVLTPLKLANAPGHVLVDRGWIAAGASRSQLPEISTPANEVRIEGWALERLPHALQSAPARPGAKVRQNLDLDEFAKETGLALAPVVVEELSGPQDGLVRERPRPETGVDMHRAYALQWYSLAALALVLAAVFSFKRVQAS
jgi:surfeit locus 1 family protein